MDQGSQKGTELPRTARSGSVHVEFKRCGKSNCRCNKGLRHGPYYYHYWREHGQLRKRYVRADRLTETLEQVALQKSEEINVSEILRDLRRSYHDGD